MASPSPSRSRRGLFLALCLTASGPLHAQLITVPPPAGISGQVIVTAPPGGAAVIYTVGLLGLFNKAKLNQITIQLSGLAAPLSAGLAQSDFVQLRLIESTNATFGDGDDVLLNTVPQAAIDVAGGLTAVSDGGNATQLGIFPLPLGPLFRFYFLVADMAPAAVTGDAFRLGAAANHIATSVPSSIGVAVTAQNANRVVVNQLVPVIGLAPGTLSFGNVLAFAASSLAFTVSNIGAANLVVTGVSSDDPAFFPDIAAFSVPPAGSQVVNVAFTPTAAGPRAATLSIAHNDTLPSAVTTLSLSGTGISPTIGVAPSPLAFGAVLVNTPKVLALTVSNTGDATLNVTNITSTDGGQFVPDLTAFTVAPGNSRVVNITFTPASIGAKSGTLSIVHDDQLTGSPTTVAMTGTGINPVIGVAPASLTFGSVQVGTGLSVPLVVSNTGSTDLIVASSLSDDGQFAPAVSSFTVAPGGSRVVQVAFTPAAAGAQSGTLSISHNAAGSPTTVSMSGTGTDPGISLSPTSLAFGSVAVGSFLSLPLTVSNPGTSTLNVTAVASDDPQYMLDLTSFSVVPAGSQVVNVTFAPTTAGAQPAVLSLTHNAGGSPSAVALSGTGTSPDIGLSPASLAFGDVMVGSAAALTLTVSNPGGATLSVTNIVSDDGQFAPVPTTFSVAPGGSQAVTVTFAPAASGAQSGTLTITHNGTGSPAAVPMGGTGTVPQIGLAPASLTFGSVLVGSAASLALTVTNPGSATLVVSGVNSNNGQFAPGLASFVVAAGGSQVVNVAFAPAATGAQSGTLTLTHNAAGSPSAVSMSGTGVAPVIGVAPASLAYGDVAIGSPSALSVTVSNTGTATLNVSSVSASSPRYLPDVTSFSVTTGGSQVVNVTFTPNTEGLVSATLSLVHDAAGSPTTVSLSGTGTSPGFSLSPPSLSFGSVPLGSSATLPVTVSNSGNLPLSVTNITSSDGQFVPDIASFTVAAGGGSRVVNVAFAPTSSGAKSASLTIAHNATGSPGTVPLSGAGASPGIFLSLTGMAFGNVTFGSPAQRTVTVSNVGGAALSVTDISSSDPQFVAGVGSLSLAPGASQIVTVTFTATSLGSKSGILFFTHDAAGGLVSLPMTADATVGLSASGLSFGTLAPSTSEALSISVSNPSPAPVTITSVVSDNPRFVPDRTTFTIAAGGSEDILVRFTPTRSGESRGTLSITHNPTVTVALVGHGYGSAGPPGAGKELAPFQVPYGGEGAAALFLGLWIVLVRVWGGLRSGGCAALRWSRQRLGFAAVFALCIGLLALAVDRWQAAVGAPYLYGLSRVAAAGLDAIGVPADLDATPLAEGFCVLTMERAVFHVTHECTGLYALCIFVAAVVAYPCSLARKAPALGLGLPAFFAYSSARLVALGAVAHLAPGWVQFCHLFLLVLVNIGFVLFLWSSWVNRIATATRVG